ncbi:hypothetical protein Pint_07145 [Pistacia integerrima]|uniref:Uncharacterized protein n=1 Tax=Pistacia integerrima TaxID=434235 RepID=A0ACC0Y0A7_9ROSI|nr:hypothetical protein Pint_07145 [Pistacia integerrima]
MAVAATLCKRFARELRVVIVSVNYRLAPEHRFPCQQEDGVDVLNFIDTTNIEGFPACANFKHCFIAGDSAGGSLAHQVTLEAIQNNFQKRTDWMWKAFLLEGSNRDHPAANVFGPNAIDISGLNFPATVVVVGGLDTSQDWQKRYYEGLKKSGKEAYMIEYPNAVHSFYGHPELSKSSMLIEEVRDFIRRQCAKT